MRKVLFISDISEGNDKFLNQILSNLLECHSVKTVGALKPYTHTYAHRSVQDSFFLGNTMYLVPPEISQEKPSSEFRQLVYVCRK